LFFFLDQKRYESTKRAIKDGQSSETGNINKTRQEKVKKQHNKCWTPLHAS